MERPLLLCSPQYLRSPTRHAFSVADHSTEAGGRIVYAIEVCKRRCPSTAWPGHVLGSADGVLIAPGPALSQIVDPPAERKPSVTADDSSAISATSRPFFSLHPPLPADPDRRFGARYARARHATIWDADIWAASQLDWKPWLPHIALLLHAPAADCGRARHGRHGIPAVEERPHAPAIDRRRDPAAHIGAGNNSPGSTSGRR
jgi:hypothetical protein